MWVTNRIVHFWLAWVVVEREFLIRMDFDTLSVYMKSVDNIH